MTEITPARWNFTLLRAASFRLDGGSMFGLIPRSVWSRVVPTDDKGRITMQHNCLYLERATDPGSAGLLVSPVGAPTRSEPRVGGAVDKDARRLLIEVGTGDKLDAKMREIFALETNPATGKPRTIVDALAEVHVLPDSIDAIAVSHLHFDHAGAFTRLPRPGEQPEFAFTADTDGGGGSSQAGGCCRTFPRAAVYVQAREWADARAARSVMTRTYYPDHLLPMESSLRLLDSPRPFPIGFTPGRDDLPPTPVELRETELWSGAGITAFLVPGHTWGQQALKFTEPDPPAGKGRTIVFTPDVMPTVNHVGAAYSLGYDVEPYTSMVTRRWLLSAAAANGWVLCLDHEPGHPLVRVKENGRGWFELVPESL